LINVEPILLVEKDIKGFSEWSFFNGINSFIHYTNWLIDHNSF